MNSISKESIVISIILIINLILLLIAFLNYTNSGFTTTTYRLIYLPLFISFLLVLFDSIEKGTFGLYHIVISILVVLAISIELLEYFNLVSY